MKPNWRKWLDGRPWTLEEAADLLLDFEPGTVPDELAPKRDEVLHNMLAAVARGELPAFRGNSK